MDIPTQAFKSDASFSQCRQYRWSLTRYFDGGNDKIVNFIMLNPSTANEAFNDPTVARCENRTIEMGYSQMIVTNIFAYRATDPKDMRAQTDPIGPENDETIVQCALRADHVICAWGNHGEYMNRGQHVRQILVQNSIHNTYYLKMNKCGEPAHPLYLRADLEPVPWIIKEDLQLK